MRARNGSDRGIIDRRSTWVIAVGLTALAATVARAQTIYQDSFGRGSGGSPAALSGSSPDQETGLAGGSASATWLASNWTTDGTKANLSAPGNSQAFLPFVPQAGNFYSLTTTLNTANSSGSWWLSLGFSATSSTSGGQFHELNTVYAWMLERGSTASLQDQIFAGPGVAGVANVSTVTGPASFNVVLNTTASPWTASFAINGATVGSTLNLPAAAQTGGSNPIQFVGFGSGGSNPGGGTGSVSNFSLILVPEPASLGALGFAIPTLLSRRRLRLRRRRRRRARG